MTSLLLLGQRLGSSSRISRPFRSGLYSSVHPFWVTSLQPPWLSASLLKTLSFLPRIGPAPRSSQPDPFGAQRRRHFLKEDFLHLQTRLGSLRGSWRPLLSFTDVILLVTQYLCESTKCLPLLDTKVHEGCDPVVLSHGWSSPQSLAGLVIETGFINICWMDKWSHAWVDRRCFSPGAPSSNLCKVPLGNVGHSERQMGCKQQSS